MSRAVDWATLVGLAFFGGLLIEIVRVTRRNAREKLERERLLRKSADTTALIGHPSVFGYGVGIEDTPEGRELLRKALLLAGNDPEEAKRLSRIVPLNPDPDVRFSSAG